MELDDLIGRLRKEKGAVRVEIMPRDLCEMIINEEATVTGASGMLPVKNKGLDELLTRNTIVVVFEDGDNFYK